LDDAHNEKSHEFRKFIRRDGHTKKASIEYLLGIPNLTLPSIYHTPNPVSLSIVS
jgi:hypothetical protein